MTSSPRPVRWLAAGAAALVLAGCAAEPESPPAPPEPAETTTASVTLDGATGTLELTGDVDADIEALVEDFPREHIRDIACDPPGEDDEYIFWFTWEGQMDYVIQQEGDWYAAEDAIRVIVHYACPEHYDVVDEALG
ncbi:hypothetical protein [Brachybacterium massiliense]|uniref:hypothetical protein n=1 Tax=Brachybacterium massiliense TaxID=1755098 RepID=UPI001121F736|nr:hypothetical protein [Brachybacterium massiliense]